MAENYHIDISKLFFEEGNTGIACLGIKTNSHNGACLVNRVKKRIKNNLCIGPIGEEYAKLYAICIYFLIKDNLGKIKELIICNDEEFIYVKEYLCFLLDEKKWDFKIINITEFRKKINKNIRSPADNVANSYRKRGHKRVKWHRGTRLNVVQINYTEIEKNGNT